MSDLEKYLGNEENLPEFMKDFHDQKDLFKAIYDHWSKDKGFPDINWVDAHVFTIDIFLWWMGLHGYKLQKIRKKGLEFYDPVETIKHFNDIRNGKVETLLKGSN